MLLPASKRRKTIGVREVEEVVAKIARIPPKSVSTDDKTVLANLERDLKTVVFGQDAAIASMATAIKLAPAGSREARTSGAEGTSVSLVVEHGGSRHSNKKKKRAR